MQTETIALIASLFAIASSVVSILTFLISRKKDRVDSLKQRQKEHEEMGMWMSEVKCRLDNHNRYAKLYNQHSNDINKIQQDVSYIKGMLDKE